MDMVEEVKPEAGEDFFLPPRDEEGALGGKAALDHGSRRRVSMMVVTIAVTVGE